MKAFANCGLLATTTQQASPVRCRGGVVETMIAAVDTEGRSSPKREGARRLFGNDQAS